jgi:hypothetical protein
MQDNQSGVQGLLTLNYHSHEQGNTIEASAAQLSAGDKNSVVLLEFCQEKQMGTEENNVKDSKKYSIDADKLISLIKEHGAEVQ